jgi:hypothetical protein
MLALVKIRANSVSNKARRSQRRHGLAVPFFALRLITNRTNGQISKLANRQIEQMSKSANWQISESQITPHASRVLNIKS